MSNLSSFILQAGPTGPTGPTGAASTVTGPTGSISNPAAGTTSTPPITFTSGTNTTTAVAGAMEYDGNEFFLSPASSSRAIVPSVYWARQHATRALTSSTSVQKIFGVGTNGALSLPIGVYFFECHLFLTGMSGTTGNGAFSIPSGTATTTNFFMQVVGLDATTQTTAAAVSGGSTATSATGALVAVTGTGTSLSAIIRGTFEVTSAGTIIPSFALTTGIAATVAIGTFFMCYRLGGASDVSFGNWS